jgi:hypothetical protein
VILIDHSSSPLHQHVEKLKGFEIREDYPQEMYNEHGPRATKLKQAYKNMIQESFKNEDQLKKAFFNKNPPLEDSYSFSMEPSTDKSERELREEDFDSFMGNLKRELIGRFKSKVSHIIEKLDALDKQISEKRINLRDIRDEDYIREIFESHFVDKKMEICKYIEKRCGDTHERQKLLRNEIATLEKRLKTLKDENSNNEEEYGQLCVKFKEAIIRGQE